ncbi:MAG: Smr/MutS family protein [Deltaproteobacteria bacterium]|jgi:DNA mismatch repair protein MutS2|nr:Smr/MutS family protein [Deltaproteobacteria bacterium]
MLNSPPSDVQPASSPLDKEYQEYLELLKDYTQSEPGRRLALKLTPTLSPPEILESWKLIKESIQAIQRKGSPDFSLHLDLTVLLEKLNTEGAILLAEEILLLKDEASCTKNIFLYFRDLAAPTPTLYQKTQNLGDFTDFLALVTKSLSPEGEILDTASQELQNIREKITLTRKFIKDKLFSLMRSHEFSPLLMDEIVTTRKDRFVIPVRASDAKSRGLVHDWSHSGATAYLEPMETVADNNQLAFLKNQEAQEIQRILANLSQQGKEIAPSLLQSGEILSSLDLLFASGRIALDTYAIAPDYAPGKGIYLKSARHPLLERRLASLNRQMTPLDFQITPEKPLLVISGLNTGGKTVALKTLGISILLAKTGLFVLAREGSYLDFPEEVLAIMGDNQDLDSDLSTFSGHIRSLIGALQAARPGALLLIDELGNGTDPQEGAALAIAVLDYLQGTGATILAATHFHLVKTWAILNPKILSVAVNSTDQGLPAYGLSYGTPGFSGGLNMASRLGLPSFLIEKAQEYLDDNHLKSLELLKQLDLERAALSKERKMLEQERLLVQQTLIQNQEDHAKKLDKLNREAKEQEFKIKTALSQNRKKFEAFRAEIQDLLNKGKTVTVSHLHNARAQMELELKNLIPNLASELLPAPTDLKPGDTVFVKSLRLPGTVTSWDISRQKGTITCGNITINAQHLDLGRWDGPPKKQQETLSKITFEKKTLDSHVGELKLLGLTVEEATHEIEKRIDISILGGQPNLRIIHGHGTGKLKSGITEYLKKHPRVVKIDQNPGLHGGFGVTEVVLDV